MNKIFYVVVSLFVCICLTSESFAQISYPLCLSTGYRFDSALSNPLQDLNSVSQDSNGVFHAAGGGAYGQQISFSIDSSGHFTNLKIYNFGNADPVGGFMTKDNPGGFPIYPAYTTGFTSDVYNNTYDSVRRTFFLHYGYSANGSIDEDSFTTQIYEKIVPYPSIHSFSPLIGPAGTSVTIKGWGFLNVNYVTFNDVPSDFTIVSDSEIAAKAPAGAGAGVITASILKNPVPNPYLYSIGNTGSSNAWTPFTYQSSDPNLPAPRTVSGLYSQGDTTVCRPWVKDSVNWASYLSTDSNGTHLEMQTLFQDEPGNLCGFQSLAADTSIERVNYWWTGFDPLYPYFHHLYKQGIEYFSRNYRINFGDTVFAHPVGVRLFFSTAELNEFMNRKGRRGESGGDISNFFITRYDGPNEDTDLYNNADDSTDYTTIKPSFFYYGLNNEYCYFEFYTDRFSEFQIATLTGSYLLPVKLISFFATAQNHKANINWQTTNEVNTFYFKVQRSVDGIHFTNIGTVKAAGTGGNHNYTYNDDFSLLSNVSTIYYRLQVTDKDGSNTGSKVVSVTVAADKLITILPNPAHSVVTVTSSVAGGNIIITDMSGRILLTRKNISSTEKINVSTLAKGVYSMRIDYTGGYALKKFIVE